MSAILSPTPTSLDLPDHTQLPDSDGAFVENFQELPQSILLTDAIEPVLLRLYPDEMFAIGQNSGIYWRPHVVPPERGAVAPDWYYVPGVPRLAIKGGPRRSYVMWKELKRPYIVLEYVSGDGSEERDRTPETGKFWIYEHEIQPVFYGIYEVDPGRIEMYKRVKGHFKLYPANERGNYPIPGLGVELGIWHGKYACTELPWMRWYDNKGRLLPTGHEIAEQERQRANQEKQRANQEKQRAEHLAERLRALGIDPDKE